MSENKKIIPDAMIGNALPEGGFPVFVPWTKEEPVVIVCDVCGHKNPENTSMCEMCSNYLDS